MAVPDSGLRIVSGHLIKDPTDLSAPGNDGNYGGTILGTFQAFRLRLIPLQDPLRMGGYGNETRDVLFKGWDVEVTGILRNYDADGLAAALPNTAAPAVAADVRQLLDPGAQLDEGDWLSDLTSVLLWAPHDPENPGLVVYQAVPFYADEIVLNLSGYEELAVEARWLATRHASNGKYRLGAMNDLASAGL